MQTTFLIAVIFMAVSLAVASGCSIMFQRNTVFIWKEEIADELVRSFNVDYLEAFRMVDSMFPFRSVMYRTEDMDQPNAIALKLFWHRADNSGWMPHHFNSHQLPEVLYNHRSWGGIIVEA
jgi:hypothetical protein